jgi:hypothetical protein
MMHVSLAKFRHNLDTGTTLPYEQIESAYVQFAD